jgi:AraC family transcriptional activator of tynA and feaB
MDAPAAGVIKLSTADVPMHERYGWLHEVIGREYVKVEVSPPGDDSLFNEMTIHPWEQLRLSAIRSSAITIERLPGEPYRPSQDAYFAVVLLSGRYALEQQGRLATLKPGDMTLYDAIRPHRIHCSQSFSKLIVSIPRTLLKDRMGGIEHCTALRIPGDEGLRAVASGFIRSVAGQAHRLQVQESRAVAGQALDLLTMAVSSVRPAGFALSRSRSTSLFLIKEFVERHLCEPDLNATTVAAGVGLSSRYVNDLLKAEDTSLMRYVWQRRLEKCREDLLDLRKSALSLTDIAYRRGFNDMAHFSRVFKQRYGCSPRAYRRQALSGLIPPQ